MASKRYLTPKNIFRSQLLGPTDNYPLTVLDRTHLVEGYWYRNSSDKIYPMPKSCNHQVEQQFLKKLKEIMKRNERKILICKGFDYCRLCNKMNGASEYSFKKDGITFTFPIDLLHYYEDHNVQPSDEFYDFIMNY